MPKREDHITWDDYFMGIAILSGYRSKDPATQVGACIVDSKTNRIISVGYNGLPVGCSDDEFPWEREGKLLETKYPFVVHAELNAILNNRTASFDGSKIYTTLFPCNECTKAIIQAGIKEIIYLSDKYAETDNVKASKLMLEKAGVKWRRFESTRKQAVLKFEAESDS
ncbi:MAG TPA: dCMP deaminase family protein [Candidatus Atribacteria bacterium]|nr:dCMP deaminase family protein [Candidatus Atribacteria bacterium]HPT78361.1 dCMP deaminase family protein [Candidatus Atribacteria bacterium]